MKQKRIVSFFVAICLLFATVPTFGLSAFAAGNWQEDSAAIRQRIEIVNQTDETFYNAPVLVKIDSTQISSKDSIRFYANGGNQELPFEIETWNPTGTSSVWVKIPTVADGDTTTIFGYYNGDKTATASSDVWDDHYVLVEHFANADISMDSTGTKKGSLIGKLTTKESTMGTGAVFSGQQKIVYDALLSGEDAFTISAVVEATKVGSYVGIATRDKNGGTKDGDTYFLGINGGSKKFLGRFYGTKANKDISTAYTSGYHVLTLTYTGTKLSLYVDGVLKTSADISGGTVDETYSTPLTLGAYSDEELMNTFEGLYDEVQLSTTATSDDWETFRNANYRGTCVSAGPIESRNGELVFTIASPTEESEVEAGMVTVTGYVNKDAKIFYSLNDGDSIFASSVQAGSYSFTIPVYSLGQQKVGFTAENTTNPSDNQSLTRNFKVVDTVAPSQPILSDGSKDGILSFGSATLSAQISQAEEEITNVDFYQQTAITLNKENTIVRQGSSLASLPAAIVPTSGTESENFTPITTGDDANPYQIYTITLNEEQQAAKSFHLIWKGSSDRQVGAYVYDYSQYQWTLLGTGSGEQTVIEMEIKNNGVLKDGKLSVLIWRGLNESLANRDSYIPETDEYDFNLMWTSDTQFYAQNANDTEMMTQQFQWVIDNFDKLKSTMFLHTGDLVNVAEQEGQWKNIDAAYKLVEEAGVPYAVVTGNHDLGASDYYSKYFPVSRLSKNNQYFMGTKDNNYYYTFEESGAKFLVLCLDMRWQKSDIEWANNVLKQYPDYFGILLVHDYLTVNGDVEMGSSYADVRMLHDELVAVNDNIQLILCGHNHGVNTNLEYFGDRAVYSVLADYQSLPRGGLGYMRMLKFDVENDLIYVNTYSPYEDKTEYFTDKQADKAGLYQKNKDEFVIQTELGGSGTRTLTTSGLSMTADTASPIGKTVTVKGTGTAEIVWSGLEAGKTYSWFAVLTDLAGNETKTALQTFTVATDCTALNDIIAEAQGYTDLDEYTTESVQAFTTALNAALAIDENASQTEINEAVLNLRKAIDGLQLKAHVHAAKKVERKEPTSTESGNIEYWYCEACGKYFADEALTKELSKEEILLLPTGTNGDNSENVPGTGDQSGAVLNMALILSSVLLVSIVIKRKNFSEK